MAFTVDGSNGLTFPDSTTMASATQLGLRNRIINGAMQIDQRNAGAAVTNNSGAAVYNVDRWYGTANGGGVWTAQQSSTVPTGFANSLIGTVTTADSSIAAGDYYTIEQRIEGLNVADFGFGTASAVTVTLSFWVRSSITGTYGVGLLNASYNRSYVATYVINSANTWEYKTITIPGDTSGTWLKTNSIGAIAIFDLGSGTTYNQTANVWSATASWRTSGCVNWIANNAATFYITGVQLERGSAASPFDWRPYPLELEMAERYFEKFTMFVSSSTSNPFEFRTTKRTAATMSTTDVNVAFAGVTPTAAGFWANRTAAASGADVVFSASAEL